MRLSRNARRRLALYGSALGVLAVVGLILVTAPEGEHVHVRTFDVSASRQHEATRMLRDLVRFDTTNPPGGTRGITTYLGNAFACEGIPFEIVGDDPERPIIVARLEGMKRGDGLLLLNHLDVVPAGDLTKWRKPPFAAEFGDGVDSHYLIGRGTLDMKGQAVASFFAMAALRRAGIRPLRDIVFVGEPMEETYEPMRGIGWVLKNRPDLLEGVTDALNEAGVNEVVGDSIARYGIEVMQKAVLIWKVKAKTREQLDALRVFLEARNAEQRWSLDPLAADFLRFLAPSRADTIGKYLADPEAAFRSEFFRKTAPDVYIALLKDQVYATAIAEEPGGGFSTQVVVTLLPGTPVLGMKAKGEAWFRDHGVTSEITMQTPDCFSSPQSGRAWEVLNEVLAQDPVEKAPVGVYVLSGYFSHSSYVRAQGIRTYGVSPFNINFNDAQTVHREGERIHVGLFLEGVARYERIVKEYATRP
ncbi:MAG: M20/M25/M40 family metallo-hydrolase [Acidobacteria bacterium]|nr:M20/M25/M40 family metallo-hydrolase [Acidobacteriota bacterium]